MQYLMDHGGTFDAGTALHHMTLYRAAASSALVFNAGTVQWAWGLDPHHDIDDPPRKNKHSIRVMRDVQGADPAVRQATVNILADMNVQVCCCAPALAGVASQSCACLTWARPRRVYSDRICLYTHALTHARTLTQHAHTVQPAVLEHGLVRADTSDDVTSPSCEILSVHAPWEAGSAGMWVVEGRAWDNVPAGRAVAASSSHSQPAPSAGTVAGVEVSLDGGVRWHPADALEEEGGRGVTAQGSWKYAGCSETWHELYEPLCAADTWKGMVGARAKLSVLTQVLCRAVDDSVNIGSVSSAADAADKGLLRQRGGQDGPDHSEL